MSGGKMHVGVGGWTYEPWRGGVFYPEKWPQAKELDYAGQHLTGIEINGTFYGRQKPASFIKWRDSVPDGFVFNAKASRYCTNRKVLAEAKDSIANFVEQGITELGDKLGPILWQLAATKQFDAADIEAFLALLPNEQDGVKLRHAIEPRHASFDDPAFFALARAANVAVVYAEAEAYPTFAEQTADFTYARIQTAREDLPLGYTEAELDRLAGQAREWKKGGRDVFLFFISGDKVKNPAAAQALIARLEDEAK
jgi:uncharacterized protein YecE (DUF72 family)